MNRRGMSSRKIDKDYKAVKIIGLIKIAAKKKKNANYLRIK